MEWTAIRKKWIEKLEKYRFAVLILLIGAMIMLIPEKAAPETVILTPEQDTQTSLSDNLEEILSHLQGAGKVQVLLTVKKGEQIIYQADERYSGQNAKDIQTVIITDSSRQENGLVVQTVPPVYLGAVVLCQGADNPTVKWNIVEAVSKITGLASNQIAVLKMKG